VLAVGFCNAAYFRGLEVLGATRAAVYTYLQPFLGALAALLLLGETLRPWQLLGGAVVVAGVVLGRPRPVPVDQGKRVPSAGREPELAGRTAPARRL
jgi:probable blue pigment (indigoidine) exporter